MFKYCKAILLVCLSVLSCGGCVRRRLTVRTQPPGAAVYVDNQYVGTSPTATSTTYYATRQIEVVKDGYRHEKILRRFNPPWYQLPPIDFLTDTLWPKKIRDERIVDITLAPQQMISSEELQARANSLRVQAAQGVATPLPPTISPGIAGAIGGNSVLPDPLDPTFQGDPNLNTQPTWQPGQLLQDFLAPGGNPPARIPEAGILPGGGYRPTVDPPR